MQKRLNIPKTKELIGPALIWKRAAAFAIDMFIFYIFIFTFFSKSFANLIPQTTSFSEIEAYMAENSTAVGTLSTLLLIVGLLLLIYFSYQEYKFKDTIGKRIFRIFVVSEAEELKWWQCLVRNLYCIPIFPLVLLVIVDPISMFFSQDNRRFSEIISKTKTVAKYEWS
jgi:uncharacterized RDD family membrane protein YckC